MPRNYVRKTEKAAYSKETLQKAVQAVKNGHMCPYSASKCYNIPRSTIVNHVYERRGFKSNTFGRRTVLALEVEESLAKNLHTMEKYGFGLTRKELLEVVGEYVNENCVVNPFKNGVPGEDWFLGFKKRHGLSVKKPQPVEYARKNACRPDIIYPYFDLLENTMNELNLHDKPGQIFNLDETSFSKDPSKSKVVGLRGFTSTRTISSPGKDNTTVLLGCNALGKKTPPLIIYKGKHVWDEWTSPEAYPGTVYAATANGWMESPVFETFFDKVFLPTVGQNRPILLIYDGHSTHVGINIIEKARAAEITILKIPPHTSDVLQPLDLCVNKSFKDKWDESLVKWQRQNIGKVLPKKDFAKIIGKTWDAVEPSVCIAGFRKAGIYPVNKNAVPKTKFNQILLREWESKTNMSEEPEVVDSARFNEQYRAIEHTATHDTYADLWYNDGGINLAFEQRNELRKLTAKTPEPLQQIVLATINILISGSRPNTLQQGHDMSSKRSLNKLSPQQTITNSSNNLNEPLTSTYHQSLNEHNIKSVALTENRRLLQNQHTTESSVIRKLESSVPISISGSQAGTLQLTMKHNTTCNKSCNTRVKILENRAIKLSFEDLLLKSVKGGATTKTKRRKIATGAELITNDEVYERCKIKEAEKEQKLREKEQKAKEREEKRIAREQLKKSKENKKGVVNSKNKIKVFQKNSKQARNISTSSESEIDFSLADESDVDYMEYCQNLLSNINNDSCNEDLTIYNGESVKNGASTKIKKGKIATDAKLITNDEVYERCEMKEAEKKQKLKEKEQKAKEREEKRIAREQLKKSKEDKKSVGNSKNNIKITQKNSKRARKISTSSESEIEISLADESDVDYIDCEEDFHNILESNNEELTIDNGESVKGGASMKTKRKKIAKGAELIINDDEVHEKWKNKEAEKKQKIKEKEQEAKEMEEIRITRAQLNKSQENKKGVVNSMNKTKITQKKSKRARKLSKSSESEIEISLADDSDADYIEYCENVSSGKENENYNNDLSLNNGQWVLVKFASKKSLKHFVGVVLHKDDNDYPVVKYVRKTVSKIDDQTVFTFPTIDDISEIRNMRDIVERLPKPVTGRRGQIIFNMPFKKFNIQ